MQDYDEDDPHGLHGDCPVCLDPLPPFWKTELRYTFFCCGQDVCSKCLVACRSTLQERRLHQYLQEFQQGPAGVCLLDESKADQVLRPTHCPFCETQIYEPYGKSTAGAFTRELQELVAQNACEESKRYAWAQLVLALDHLSMIGRQVEIPGNNLIVGGVRNVARGIELLCQSAEQKHPVAMYLLARQYYHGIHGMPQSVERAIPLLEACLRLPGRGGHALAGLMLAGIYMGQGNDEKTFECMEIASDLGNGEASAFIGTAHERGTNGVAVVDKEKAFSYYKLGAQQGNAVAQFFAAHLSKELLGDDEQEVKYLKMAAENGYTDAQFNLGLRYIQRGGAWIKAKTWVSGVHMLRRARTGGSERAVECLDHMEQETSGICFHCGIHAGSGAGPQGQEAKKFNRCSKCQAVYYCTEACQKAAWNAGHKDLCVKYDG